MALPLTTATPHHKVHLVLCRLASEDVSWAASAVSPTRGTQVFVYNSGPPLQLPPSTSVKLTVRELTQGGHESYCYLEHIQRSLKGGNFAAATIFAPATPRCAGSTAQCTQRVMRVMHSLGSAKARLEPNGFAPIEPAPIADFWEGIPRSLTCLPDQYGVLSQGRDFHTDADFLSFSPYGSFAVARKNLLSAPRGWLRRANEALRNATGTPPRLNLCCDDDRTCMPWLLQRMWPMLLGTPQRGCSGVITGYCRNEWNAPQRKGKDGKLLPQTVRPPVGVGAIKHRLDVSRVGRVARFANDLSDEERDKFMELLAAEAAERRAARRGAKAGGAAAAESTCTTQLCAILTLLDKARAKDDSDFALYLTSAVNASDTVVRAAPVGATARSPQPIAHRLQPLPTPALICGVAPFSRARQVAPERSERRCRQLFVDKKVLEEGVERVQFVAPSAAAATLSAADELRSGQLLHSAIRKVYTACLRQMEADPRWFQRPFVYGFAKEPHQVVPNVD